MVSLPPCRRVGDVDPGGGDKLTEDCGSNSCQGRLGCQSANSGGRWPGGRGSSRLQRLRRPNAPGSRSRPASPQVLTRPTSPVVYSPAPQPPVYMMPSSVAVPGPVMVGVQQPFTFPCANPSTSTTQMNQVITQVTMSDPVTGLPAYPHVNVGPTFHPPVFPPPHSAQSNPASYYTGSPYMQCPSSRPNSRPVTPDVQHTPDSERCGLVGGTDIEDISLRPRPRGQRQTGRRKVESTEDPGISDTCSTKSDAPHTPPLKLPVSSLPSPLDAPGIPIQDEVCPFHERTSEWLALRLVVFLDVC